MGFFDNMLSWRIPPRISREQFRRILNQIPYSRKKPLSTRNAVLASIPLLSDSTQEQLFVQLARQTPSPTQLPLIARQIRRIQRIALAEGYSFEELSAAAQTAAASIRGTTTASLEKGIAQAVRTLRQNQKTVKQSTRTPKKQSRTPDRTRVSHALSSHLQSSFFYDAKQDGTLTPRRFRQNRSNLINALAATGTKHGVQTEILKYQNAEHSPPTIPSPAQFMLVHLTGFIPKNGIINPTSAYRDDVLRESIHFSVNSAVGSHMYGQWQGKNIAILMPAEGALHWLSNFYTVDSYGFGKLKLPHGTVILMDKHTAAAEKISNGQLLGRAQVKIVDLPKLSRTLRSSGIITLQKKNALLARMAQRQGLSMNSRNGIEKYNQLEEQISQTLRRKGVIENYTLESPMHLAVVKELLHQGKLPMVASMWSWTNWWGNAGLSRFAQRYGFTQGPHSGHIGHRIEELSSQTAKQPRQEITATARQMRRELKTSFQENPIKGPRQQRVQTHLKRKIMQWHRKRIR